MPPARRAYASERIPNDEGRTFCQSYKINIAKQFHPSSLVTCDSLFDCSMSLYMEVKSNGQFKKNR